MATIRLELAGLVDLSACFFPYRPKSFRNAPRVKGIGFVLGQPRGLPAFSFSRVLIELRFMRLAGGNLSAIREKHEAINLLTSNRISTI